MILEFLLIITSVLLGSAFSKILAKAMIYQKGINLFPSLNLILSQRKSFDILEFCLFVIISICIFFILFFIFKKKKYLQLQEIIIGAGNAIFALFVYLSVVFVNYSGKDTVVFAVLWYFIFFVLSFFIPKTIPKWIDGKKALFNGIITGFYFLIVLNNLTTSVAVPLASLAVVPIYFYLFSDRFKLLKNPGFIPLFLSFIFPFKRIALLIIASVTFVIIFAIQNKDFSKYSSFLNKIYPIIVLFIFLYNPIFYFGTFDTVEEGFWAGWLQHLLAGQFIYRDFAAYHPPILIWGLYIFSKIFGASLYNLRLYFHILQILGLTIIFTVLSKIVKTKPILIGIFILIVAYGSSLVRNNIGIRVGSGLLPLLFVYWYSFRKKRLNLIFAGATTALTFFISIETGVSAVIAVVVAVCLSSSKKTFFKDFLNVFTGGAAVLLLIMAFLALNNAAGKFVEYVVYYSKIFTGGYMNLPVQQAEPQTLIQWYVVIKYIQTSGFLWELTKFSLIGGLFLAVIKKFHKDFGPIEILVIGIAVFGLVLSRSALGRSDGYHIAFVWFPALLLIAYLLQFIDRYSKSLVIGVLSILIFLVGIDATQVSLIQNQLIKFQTYGNLSGSYPSYKTARAGIFVGIETNPKDMDDLITFIDSKVGKNEKIFVFPLQPEIYFLADRNNATSFDTPTAFYTDKYQNQMLEEIEARPPKLIIYKKGFEAQNPDDSLYDVNAYILKNYKVVTSFGDNLVMEQSKR